MILSDFVCFSLFVCFLICWFDFTPYHACLQPDSFCSSLVWLNGTRSGNTTETFIGFMIYAYNEFNDEESGDFLSPLPAGVSKKECHFNSSPQYVSKARSTPDKSLENGETDKRFSTHTFVYLSRY